MVSIHPTVARKCDASKNVWQEGILWTQVTEVSIHRTDTEYQIGLLSIHQTSIEPAGSPHHEVKGGRHFDFWLYHVQWLVFGLQPLLLTQIPVRHYCYVLFRVVIF